MKDRCPRFLKWLFPNQVSEDLSDVLIQAETSVSDEIKQMASRKLNMTPGHRDGNYSNGYYDDFVQKSIKKLKTPEEREVEAEAVRLRDERISVNRKALLQRIQISCIPSLSDEVYEEHTKDIASFQMHTIRWGDFLDLHLERGFIQVDRKIGEPKPNRMASAVNLNLVREIIVVPGTPPNLNGKFFTFCNNKNSEEVNVSNIPRRRNEYPMLFETSNHVNEEVPYSSVTIGTEEHMGMPQFARDDVINFIGLGKSLAVPYGMGDRVRTDILLAIANEDKKFSIC